MPEKSGYPPRLPVVRRAGCPDGRARTSPSRGYRLRLPDAAYRAPTIMPAATVLLVDSSIRMKPPVIRLRA